MKVRVLIADSLRLSRESWTFLLNSDQRFMVVGECDTPEKVLELTAEKLPDIILMGLNAPITAVLNTITTIGQQHPESNIIAIDTICHSHYVKKMMKAGAKGYVTRNSSSEEMLNAILEVSRGARYICDEVKTLISYQLLVGESTENEPNVGAITNREMEIINKIKEGYSSKQIAGTLLISYRTVEVHRHNILRKLKIKNTAGLINFIHTTAAFC